MRSWQPRDGIDDFRWDCIRRRFRQRESYVDRIDVRTDGYRPRGDFIINLRVSFGPARRKRQNHA